jgi:hypothetical protein
MKEEAENEPEKREEKQTNALKRLYRKKLEEIKDPAGLEDGQLEVEG